MRKVDIVEPTDDKWKKWCAEGERLRDEHIAAHARDEAFQISDRQYKGQKARYEKWFNGKCAYCEERVATNQYGPIEHYRPKRAVKDERGASVTRAENGALRQHPGYFWLAYDWRNLLYSCTLCNGNQGQGKGNKFPVSGDRSWAHDDDIAEEPMLLHPVFDDPVKHIEFDPKKGGLKALSDRGQATIDILGLNLRDLPRHRKDAYNDTVEKFHKRFNELPNPSDDDLLRIVEGLRDDEFRAFTLAICDAVKVCARQALEKKSIPTG